MLVKKFLKALRSDPHAEARERLLSGKPNSISQEEQEALLKSIDASEIELEKRFDMLYPLFPENEEDK